MPQRLVSLDLDGTLIHPAIFNVVADALGFGEPLQASYDAYLKGEMTLEEAFHHDYKHFVGREVAPMLDALDKSPAWTPGITEAVTRLQAADIDVILTTDQPRFLAESTRRFGIHTHICSEADLRHGRVTADIHPRFEKWPNLQRHLQAKKIDPKNVTHVGNGTNDIPVFQKVGTAISVNALSPQVNDTADHVIPRLEDLEQVADLVLQN